MNQFPHSTELSKQCRKKMLSSHVTNDRRSQTKRIRVSWTERVWGTNGAQRPFLFLFELAATSDNKGGVYYYNFLFFTFHVIYRDRPTYAPACFLLPVLNYSHPGVKLTIKKLNQLVFKEGNLQCGSKGEPSAKPTLYRFTLSENSPAVQSWVCYSTGGTVSGCALCRCCGQPSTHGTDSIWFARLSL